ncbi:MAG: prepilin-type N-terminal cleavage/methylation domain-containing protein [Nitrospirae bacterium]|nr:prepilin-type N-terminal cleavage/methylation domain-containing protein [Nitrospirota bacterium]
MHTGHRTLPLAPSLTMPGRGRPAGEAGFTLLELIIVIFLITLMLGLSAAFFANALPSGRFNATSREIASAIRQARHLATLNGERQVITFDMDARSYGIEGRGKKNLPPEIAIKVIDPLAGDITNGKYSMTFYARGSAEGGTIVLWNSSRAAHIHIDPVAGAVIIK